MITPVVRLRYFAALIFAVQAFGQQNQSPAPPAQVNEFPIVFQQNLVAGKTAVGTKVKAKLMFATLQNGTVIPRNAVLSGEVLESAAKTSSDPSRLEVRFDQIEWKGGSAPVKAYVTNWYYPTALETGQDLQYGPTQSEKTTWNGQGEYPNPNAKSYHPFPGGRTDQGSAAPDTTNSVTSKHRDIVKDVACERLNDGSLILTSKRSNVKLDHYTTYVLLSGDLPVSR